MRGKSAGATIVPYPRTRLLMVDGGRLARRKHTVHGLVEFDITESRRSLHRHKAQGGEAISFIAFFLSCLGRAIDEDRVVQSYRDWRNRLVCFDDVDVNMLFEVVEHGEKTIRPRVIRSINTRSALDIQREITMVQSGGTGSAESKFIDRFVLLPGFIRRLALTFLLKNPRLVKELYGTVLVSSVGMFGKGIGWGLPMPNHSLQITLGGIDEVPRVVAHRVEARKCMCVTISFDHDIIDGAPVARFTERLRRLVEAGYEAGQSGEGALPDRLSER